MQTETQRLRIRKFDLKDAPTMLAFLNDPDFVRFVADRGVRTIADAEGYLLAGPLKSYNKNGFGMFCVELRDSREPIGMCGLLKRDELPNVDLGYMFMPNYRQQGYASEAALGVIELARQRFGLDRLLAIVNPDNVRSIGLLKRLGYHFYEQVPVFEDGDPLSIYALEL